MQRIPQPMAQAFGVVHILIPGKPTRLPQHSDRRRRNPAVSQSDRFVSGFDTGFT
jgi:hypothetical protein